MLYTELSKNRWRCVRIRKLDNEKVQKRQKQLQSEKMHEAEKKLRTMQLSQEKIEADLQNAYEAYKAGITDKETYLEQRQVYEQIEDKIQETVQKQMKIVSEYEEKVLTMSAGFDIIESRTKVMELNREIVETFVDRIVNHEGGEIEIVVLRRIDIIYVERGCFKYKKMF